VVDLAKKIEKKMDEWKVTEMIADKFEVPFMPHTLFTVSISSCPNNCTAAETKDFGIHGVPSVVSVQKSVLMKQL
jgi:dissimilatory sulfite reductase (desulfoviridin) alpha/beta subunit